MASKANCCLLNFGSEIRSQFSEVSTRIEINSDRRINANMRYELENVRRHFTVISFSPMANVQFFCQLVLFRAFMRLDAVSICC